MPKDSIYFSNYTRSGFAFMLYLISLCPDLPIFQSSHNIQNRRRSLTIVRDPKDVVASSIINNYENVSILSETIEEEKEKYINFYKEISKQQDLIVIDFNDITMKTEETMEAIHDILGLPFSMSDRDKNMTFNLDGHLHTSKTHPKYQSIKQENDLTDYINVYLEYEKIMKRKLIA